MTETLATTCSGYSLQRVGGRCPMRGDCKRFLLHTPGRGYPQSDFLCRVGKWDWYVKVDFAELEDVGNE